jgi:hypothetical protein
MATNVNIADNQLTVILNEVVVLDFADQDYATYSFPDPIVKKTIGKNGNSITQYLASGKRAEVTLRILRGSSDHTRLQNLQNTQAKINITFTSIVSDGVGGQKVENAVLSNGDFVNIPSGLHTASDNSEIGVVVYNLEFTQGSVNIT